MPSPRDYIELILANRIFAALAPEDAAALYKAGELLRLSDGRALFSQGDTADGFYLILSGALAVLGESGPGGEGGRLATLGVGETVGEMGLVLAGPRTATVVAEGEGLVWYLSGGVFEELLRSGDRIGISILRGIGQDMCRRFRKVVDEGERLVLALHGGERGAADGLDWELQ